MRSQFTNILAVVLFAVFNLSHTKTQAEVRYEQQKLVAPDNSVLGNSVCANNRRIIAGSPSDAFQTGAAYVFRLDNSGTPDFPGDDVWVFESKLTASDGATNDRFGESVFIKNNRAVIGARGDRDAGPGTGSAYVFRLNDNNTPLDQSDDFWTQEAKLTASDADMSDHFGTYVAIDDYWVIVGVGGHQHDGIQTGVTYIFRRDDNDTPSDHSDDTWAQTQELQASDTQHVHFFGSSVAIDGDWAVIGAIGDTNQGDYAGAAYVFRRDANDTPSDINDDLWLEQSKLTALDGASSDRFGADVTIENGWIVVGAFGDDDAGESSGSAYVFRHDDQGTPSNLADDLWVQVEKLTASDGGEDDQLGRSVSIHEGVVVVGAYRHVRGLCTDNRDLCNSNVECTIGACEQSGNGCHIIEECKPGLCTDGFTVCHDLWDCNPEITYCDSPPAEPCVGAATCGIETGAAYVFQHNDNGTPSDEGDDFWVEEAVLVASEGTWWDLFGISVSIDHGLVVVGAAGLTNVGSSSGLLYLFPTTQPADPIPAVSTWTLIVLSLLILTLGTIVLRIRQQAITLHE